MSRPPDLHIRDDDTGLCACGVEWRFGAATCWARDTFYGASWSFGRAVEAFGEALLAKVRPVLDAMERMSRGR